MNVFLSSSEHLLHRYTMESTIKSSDIRSIPIEAVSELVKSSTDINATLPQDQIDLESQRENTYNGNIL
ncbi:unnamed protein product [Rotaria sordida]|uniref:Uncharacterized protein n=1 Tax=Rotaria sordida TaxID=392033 RepID=A0A813VU98_9BILA|nr:unnamed protein product [Rotaria sordida]CAF0897818.1 unnamed protein product [Rotaria sordida]CAF0908789.1 unnamed protein product [Rotaria sordida]CAF0948342.1 unnamed protein product [Rotaria sordida]CAF0948695.1 unnamed protein product [Rotaria sordida]